jgi:tetratricopeptide (TPR) repeat protein
MRFYTLVILFLTTFSSAFSQTPATLEAAHKLMDEGKYKQAIVVLDKLLEKENSSRAIIDKSDCQFLLKDFVGGFKTLTYGIQIMPDSVQLYLSRGVILEQSRLFQEAINDFTKGYLKSKSDTMSAIFLSNRGGSKARILDYKGGYQDLIESIKLDSTKVHPYINIAPICNHLGKNEEALFFLQKAVKIDSTDVGIYVNIGYCYQYMDKHQLAIEAFDKALELKPDEPLGYSNRAYSKYKLDDLKGATIDIEKSLKLFSTNSYAYKIRALIEFAEGKTKAGCADLITAIQYGYTNQYGKEVLELQEKYCK